MNKYRSCESSRGLCKRPAVGFKFYASFENQLCNDHVTEKLFNALSTDIIPIVYGGLMCS